eukprot:3103302-Rhodomonas_salina.1
MRSSTTVSPFGTNSPVLPTPPVPIRLAVQCLPAYPYKVYVPTCTVSTRAHTMVLGRMCIGRGCTDGGGGRRMLRIDRPKNRWAEPLWVRTPLSPTPCP